jgi:hypothetical protein
MVVADWAGYTHECSRWRHLRRDYQGENEQAPRAGHGELAVQCEASLGLHNRFNRRFRGVPRHLNLRGAFARAI